MRASQNAAVRREIFSAIERLDAQRVLDLCHPDVAFIWPPSLPYSGASLEGRGRGPDWAKTWLPLQPTEGEQRMDARVVAASDDEVVALWRQRGRSASGERFDGEVLGL